MSKPKQGGRIAASKLNRLEGLIARAWSMTLSLGRDEDDGPGLISNIAADLKAAKAEIKALTKEISDGQ